MKLGLHLRPVLSRRCFRSYVPAGAGWKLICLEGLGLNSSSRSLCYGQGQVYDSWERYIEGGRSGISDVTVDKHDGRLSLHWADGHLGSFSAKLLRDHCPEGRHPTTMQRQLDTSSIEDGLLVDRTEVQADIIRVHWKDGLQHDGLKDHVPVSSFPVPWLREHCTSTTARALRSQYEAHGGATKPIFWGADIFTGSDAPVVEYNDVMREASSSSENPMTKLIQLLKRFGLAVVKGTPPTMEGTEAFAKKFGFVRHTLYGGMWATSAEGDEEGYNDTAYSNVALASHTDCTYFLDPPGLQIFCCVCAAATGGESTYVDGLAVAERLSKENPEAFDYFCHTTLPYECFDNGCHYRAEGPVFLVGRQGHIVQVRHNDSDRAPLDLLSDEELDRFYCHHQALTRIIRDPTMVARILLQPGDMVVCDNQRTLHGREGFQGRRRMVGCYVGRDELESMGRVCGV
ncbi:unnamed protein product [Discosporangium mesarthrocarpum]